MLNEISSFFTESVSFSLCLTLTFYLLGIFIHRKTGFILFTPLLVASALIIVFICIFKIPYEKYLEGSKFIYYLMTPVTAALAVPLYRQFTILKNNAPAVILGIISGILSNAFSVLALCLLFKIGHEEYVSFLPKSITTAIALALTNENGGIEAVTVLMVSFAGITTNTFAPVFCRLFGIKESVAKGVACGTCGHAMGTAKALEMGETEGAVSSLSIAVAGLLSVVILPFFVKLI
jgi:predicted murein hydrolase (TIGR00659 family)